MATVKQVRKRMKDFPQDLEFVVMIDGQYYPVNISEFRRVYVKEEKDWADSFCYGIADEDDEDSSEVLALE